MKNKFILSNAVKLKNNNEEQYVNHLASNRRYKINEKTLLFLESIKRKGIIIDTKNCSTNVKFLINEKILIGEKEQNKLDVFVHQQNTLFDFVDIINLLKKQWF